jgi:hypothetical protein
MKQVDLLEFPNEVKELADAALDVFNDFETEGCEDCGTVSTQTMEKLQEALKAVGYGV